MGDLFYFSYVRKSEDLMEVMYSVFIVLIAVVVSGYLMLS